MFKEKDMNNMKRIIEDLNAKKNRYCRIKHKRGWLDYLKDGDTVFTPQRLKDKITRIVKKYPPRGKKLFDLSLSKHHSFTMLPEEKPGKPEEALERFIVISNGDNFYNQIPVGGGKESIDIGIKENKSKFIFIELKPWNHGNSPMYAIIESLKNLVEYQTIIDEEIKKIEEFEEIELMILAPSDYYESYKLNNDKNLSVLKDTITEIGKEFDTVITFMELIIEKDFFLEECRKIYKGPGKEVVTVSKQNAIDALKRNQWKLLVSSK
jgi:hypothetical protein